MDVDIRATNENKCGEKRDINTLCVNYNFQMGSVFEIRYSTIATSFPACFHVAILTQESNRSVLVDGGDDINSNRYAKEAGNKNREEHSVLSLLTQSGGW